MGSLLALIILLVCLYFWCSPVLKKQKQVDGYLKRKNILIAFFYGAVPSAIVLFIIEVLFGWIFKWIGIEKGTILSAFLDAFIVFGLVEEASKYLFARLSLKSLKTLKKIDIMLIFGAVGAGYEIVEALMFGGPFVAIARGLTLAHVMYQFIMGHFFYKSIHAKNNDDIKNSKKYRFLCILYPTLIHGFNDFFCQLANIYNTNIASSIESVSNTALIITGISILIIISTNIFGLVLGLKLAKKEPEVEVFLK